MSRTPRRAADIIKSITPLFKKHLHPPKKFRYDVDARKKTTNANNNNIMDLQRYAERRAPIEERFRAKPPVMGTERTHLSPSGRFSLQTAVHAEGPCTWAYSRGIVQHLASQHVIADIRRNYSAFWHAWVDRPDGEYLLCGEDYQGYNVIDLQREQNIFTFPDEAFDGMGFCWAAAYPSPSGRLLAVDGCYFTDPTRSPLPELARFENLDKFKGWRGDERLDYVLEEGIEGTWKAVSNTL